MSTKLELYVKSTCPWCHKVLNFMKENNIAIPVHDIERSDDDLTYLVEVGGKRQVPCLFIDGTPLYESSDIIAYLAHHFGAQDSANDSQKPEGGACSLSGGCSF